jgi:hypothetical protein
MPHTNPAQGGLPFSGKTAISRHTSYLAALAAQNGREHKRGRYLAWLKANGPATDHQAVDALGFPLSTICSLRNGCLDRAEVTAHDAVMGAYGRKVTLWKAVA